MLQNNSSTSNTLNRLNDIFFKYLLGSEERKTYTLNFLNTTLNLSGDNAFKDLTFNNKEQSPLYVEGKSSILDILATTNTGTIINIEVQVCKDEYMAERALYYWSRIYGMQLQKGSAYDTLHPVISLILMDFNYFKNYQECHQSYHICNDVHKNDVLTPQFNMHFIELEKITFTDIKQLKQSDCWIAYFSKRVSDVERKELAKMDPILKEVLKSEQRFMLNPQLFYEYEAREKAIRDEISRIKSAERRGEIKNQEAVIKNALALNLDNETIMKLASCSLEDINRVKEG